MDHLGQDADDWRLRRFETALLGEVGYGMILDHEVSGRRPVDSMRRYLYLPGRGPVDEDSSDSAGVAVRGETLLALQSAVVPPRHVRREAKRLTARLLAMQLDGRELKSQAVLLQMTAAGKITPSSRVPAR